MEVPAEKVINSLKQIIAEQAQQIAVLRVMVEELQNTDS